MVERCCGSTVVVLSVAVVVSDRVVVAASVVDDGAKLRMVERLCGSQYCC